jgi:hypothetical protein
VSREVSIGIAASVLGFLIGTPYALLTPRAFVAGVTSELQEVGSVQFGNEGDLPAFLFHLVHSLPEGMGLPLLVCALVGVTVTVLRDLPRGLVLLAFPASYFLVIGSWSSRFERYALPLLPFLLLLASIALVTVARSVWRRWGRLARRWRPGLGLMVAAGLFIAPELTRIVYLHALLGRPDTRVLAAEWIEREVPSGSRIALEPYSPSLPVGPGGYRIHRLAPYDFEQLRAQGVEYVVLSGFMYQRHQRACDRFADECRLYRDLDQRGTLLLDLKPGRDDRPLWVGDIYSPLTRLFERRRPGPSLRIYRMPAPLAP